MPEENNTSPTSDESFTFHDDGGGSRVPPEMKLSEEDIRHNLDKATDNILRPFSVFTEMIGSIIPPGDTPRTMSVDMPLGGTMVMHDLFPPVVDASDPLRITANRISSVIACSIAHLIALEMVVNPKPEALARATINLRNIILSGAAETLAAISGAKSRDA
ncbi:MAG: hypothetical protein EHM79_00285 [Geobacter sp.]|nr:MAG: hypothetical protein EHM79_00285 [Geobacter sp.]